MYDIGPPYLPEVNLSASRNFAVNKKCPQDRNIWCISQLPNINGLEFFFRHVEHIVKV